MKNTRAVWMLIVSIIIGLVVQRRKLARGDTDDSDDDELAGASA